jgi:hypothetical protein
MFVGALVLALAGCAPTGRPIVAEVFYDAIGDDTGHEFVELFNPGPVAASLAGVRLEAGDGSGEHRWTLRWTGTTADSVAPYGRFVIGGARVDPAAQAVVQLDLQNGPDAVRLVWPDGAGEVVGYGVQEFAEYACGVSAPDVASGQSLARIPDDADLGANAADFRAAAPSPGRANQMSRNAAIVPGSLTLHPTRPAPGEPVELEGVIENRGRDAIDATSLTLTATVQGRTLFTRTLAAALAAGESVRFSEGIGALEAGIVWITARTALAGDESPADDADSLQVRVGPGPLEITEIQFHPAAGEGEWIEVRNRGDVALDPATFTLSDRGAGRGHPAAGAPLLAPESLAVLVQLRAAFLMRHPALDTLRVWSVAPWSSLNNSDDSTGIADAVVLRDSSGLTCDEVAYSAKGVPAGVPLELRDGNWWPALDPSGSPLAPPREPAAVAGRFELTPRLVAMDAVTHVAWALPWPRGRITLEIYDLAGRRVLRPWSEALVPSRGVRELSLAGLPPGVFLVALIARAESGGASLAETRTLRVRGVAP